MPIWVPYVVAFWFAGLAIYQNPELTPYVVVCGVVGVVAGWIVAAMKDEWWDNR